MFPVTHRILPLPKDVAAQIKSSISINSLDNVVLGLIENSLDARARKIDVTVDFQRGACIVEDDGCGIPSLEFSESGGLGKPYRKNHLSIAKEYGILTLSDTSKNDSTDIFYGGDGIFISSLAALSILTITSHHSAHRSHASLVLHHSRPAARLLPAPARHQLSNREHGTRITVQELFGNMPVRVKQRAAIYHGKEHEKQWDILSKKIISLLLSSGVPIKFSLRSTESPRKMAIRGKDDILLSSARDLVWPKSFDLPLICSILSQAGYIQPSDWHEWIETSACTSSVVVHGAISLKPAPSRNSQFISLGINYLNAETNSVLFDQINQIFVLSDFGKLEDVSDADISPRKRNRKERSHKQNEFTSKQLKGGGKGVDRWPMFYLRISLEDRSKRPRATNVDDLDCENTLSDISNALEAMIVRFLSDHHFRPRVKHSKVRKTAINEFACSKSPWTSKLEIPTPVKSQLASFSRTSRFNPPAMSVSIPEIELLSTKPKQREKKEEPSPRISADVLSSNIIFPILHRRKVYEEAGPGIRSRIKGVKQDSPYELPHMRNLDSTRSSLVHGHAKRISKNASTDTVNSTKKSARAMINVSTPTRKISNVTDEALETANTSSRVDAEMNPAAPLIVSPVLTTMEQNTEVADKTMKWVNPISGAMIHVSSRTGLVIRKKFKDLSLETMNLEISTLSTSKPLVKYARLNRSVSNPMITPRQGSWASEVLKNWENPVFSLTEEAIPRISLEGPSDEASCILQGRHHRCSVGDIQKAFSESSSLFSAKLTKAALKNAKIIAQVDKKFILIIMNTNTHNNSKKDEWAKPQNLLVLIDQHAADERIRIEALQADLCTRASSSNSTNSTTLNQKSTIRTDLLTKPIIFTVQEQECKLFKSQASYFANWGILYTLIIPESEARSSKSLERKVIVQNLPEAIAERCRVHPKTLIDLMRGEIWRRQSLGLKSDLDPELSIPAAGDKNSGDDDPPPTPSTQNNDPPPSPSTQNNDWLQRIGDCPRGILDMLNSRSCRSAIMFNDVLTLDECRTLVRRLSACAFPFQCAHGRPSMTPLVQLGESDLSGLSCGKASLGKISRFRDGDGGREKGFGKAWRSWRENLGNSGV